MTALVIVESPAKAKTLSSFLGKGYQVEASYGHVRDLPSGKKELPEEYRKESWADFAVNVDEGYEPIYIVSPQKKKVIAALRKALKEADKLILATDEDREGESISWHLLEVLKPKKSLPVERIVFHEITREAIQHAVDNPRKLDMDLVHAQESRRIVDRLFGYKLSPILWRKVAPGLSAGRVQSAAVRLLVEREEERRRFVSSEFWGLEATIGSGKPPFKASLASVAGKRLATGKDFDPETGALKDPSKAIRINGDRAKNLVNELVNGLPWQVSKVEEKPGQQSPAPPFITSTLQQEANRKLSYGARRTMQIAQRLYEGIDIGDGERVGLITYMRTDSVTLSDKAKHDAQSVIRKEYGPDYARGPRNYKTKTRNAQEAHEAIRPTEMSRLPGKVRSHLSDEEFKLYDLIWKRTMASQMPNAEVLRTSVEILARISEGEAVFQASGKKIVFPGYLRAYVEGSDDPAAELGDKETVLPDLKQGQPVNREGEPFWLEKLDPKQSFTQPPARYTEASLVKKLEDEGIGRPSTYASIIGTIQERGYCTLNKSKQLVPSFTAMVVTKLLRDHFTSYVDLQFTARMEEELDQIANGDMGWQHQVDDFFRGGNNGHKGLEQLVEEKVESLDFVNLSLGQDQHGREVQVRLGKYGPYVCREENGKRQMATIPEDIAPADLSLQEAETLLEKKNQGPRYLGDDPDTGLPVYGSTGRFGDYVQLGETPEDKKAEKPKRQSLEKHMSLDTIDLTTALQLLALPRELGEHPDSGEKILANKGRYGPYVQHQKDFRSLKDEDDVYTITLERALELLAEPKTRGKRQAASKTVLKDLGEDDGKKIQVLDGRYGPYVSDGKTNATLPKSEALDSITLERAMELISAKAKAPKKTKAGAKKKTTKKK